MDLHVFFGSAVSIEAKLDKILTKLEQLMKTLDDLVTDVADEKTVIDSIAVYTAGLRQQLADALSGETLSPAAQAKVDAIFAGVEANKAAIAQAMVENTPAAAIPVS